MKKESMRMKKDIRAYEYEELQKELERLGEKPFRAKQWKAFLCGISTVIRYVFPRRRDAAWDVYSALRRSGD